MTRTTVDFGIDLGTTNSAVAVAKGVDAEIIKNNRETETTPSAVWVDGKNVLQVGKAAKERSERDPDNVCVEFKQLMGTVGQAKTFKASGRSMAPEQMSAEVLKSLRADVAQRMKETPEAAVITVPAAFDLSSCDATRRAAELAGLRFTPLLQEPTAAALAYGFQAAADNVFWLVYDFGGGTFDSAVIHLRDGEFTVVNHRGDNYLGGKLIDWKIVEELLIPAFNEQYPGAGLRRGDRRWAGAIAKLKGYAEEAKIDLSRTDVAMIDVDLRDADGRTFDFRRDVTRAEVERLAAPFITQSVRLCREALDASGLGPGDIEKVLLVGGPTLAPYLRERLADPREGLGITLDYSQDPITVVARGAAIFAGSQLIPDAVRGPAPSVAGQYAVALEYKPAGFDIDPLVGGRVSGGELSGLTVEFVNDEARDAWRSGKIALGPEGTFTATLWAERGRANTFRIELRDATGQALPVTPDRLTYTPGIDNPKPSLTHSIGVGLAEGVGLADNTFVPLVGRGEPLPTRREVPLRTTIPVRRGEDRGMVLIPIMEGEHRRADRNRRIGRIEIGSGQVRRDVPEGSEVRLTLVIDESRLVVARAYLPILDEEFEHVINLRDKRVPGHADLARRLAAEKSRLAAAREQAAGVGDEAAREKLARIDDEGVVGEITALVAAAQVSPDAALTADDRLLSLRAAVDEIEDRLDWPLLVQQARELSDAARAVVSGKGDAEHRRIFDAADAAVRDAIAAHDPHLLNQRMDDLRILAMRVLDASDDLPFIQFEDLRSRQPDMSDPAEAELLMSAGRRAARAGDAETLRHINVQLIGMLPEVPSAQSLFSTVVSDLGAGRRDR